MWVGGRAIGRGGLKKEREKKIQMKQVESEGGGVKNNKQTAQIVKNAGRSSPNCEAELRRGMRPPVTHSVNEQARSVKLGGEGAKKKKRKRKKEKEK